jgi:FADH2 O2-dependent halogenase
MTLLPLEHVDVDVAIVGSGFAGALAALALRQQGRRVALIERGRHPRFAIGESTTPLANLLVEEIADRYNLPRIRVFSKWGTWQRTRPDVACGLKRGFTFLFHRPGELFTDTDDHANQLLVGASPNDEVADTHWYRPEFDWALVREAEAAGAIYLDETRLDALRDCGARVTLDATRLGRALNISAGFVIDASGPRGFLATALGAGSAPLRWLPPTQGLYTHFEHVRRWEDVAPIGGTPPYPPDAAALHHVFPGGWIWMLRFNKFFPRLTDWLLARKIRKLNQ